VVAKLVPRYYSKQDVRPYVFPPEEIRFQFTDFQRGIILGLGVATGLYILLELGVIHGLLRALGFGGHVVKKYTRAVLVGAPPRTERRKEREREEPGKLRGRGRPIDVAKWLTQKEQAEDRIEALKELLEQTEDPKERAKIEADLAREERRLERAESKLEDARQRGQL